MAFVLDNSVLMGWFVPSQADAERRGLPLATRDARLAEAARAAGAYLS